MVLGFPSRKAPIGAGGVTYKELDVTVSCDLGLQILFGIYKKISLKSDLR